MVSYTGDDPMTNVVSFRWEARFEVEEGNISDSHLVAASWHIVACWPAPLCHGAWNPVKAAKEVTRVIYLGYTGDVLLREKRKK